MAPTTTITREPRVIPYTEERYRQVVQALRRRGYLVEVNDDSDWITVTGPDALKCWMRVYDTPSKFGIDRGCVSKMQIRLGDEWLYNYDRGLDVDELSRHPDAREFFDDLTAIAS